MENKSSPDKLHGMLLAQSTLLFALIRTLSPEKFELLKEAYHQEAEAGTAHVLQAPASDALVDAFQVQVEAQRAFLHSFRP